ncbi:hypothetical protein N7537_005066 [Penicillium hordei]|uniref:Uncharacterized protein n=1 Tax=Penicillium hordei TaxID=40994 RepID=A0AAD6ECK0_9EURO|nr:uncharacterized protein N7537_005066 [Penicillium hordei]KAJ5608447.1 hypothetical protein N7537_005066 [Penicillium hordei]
MAVKSPAGESGSAGCLSLFFRKYSPSLAVKLGHRLLGESLNASDKRYASTIFRLLFCRSRSNTHDYYQHFKPRRVDTLCLVVGLPNTLSRESHTIPSTVDRQREDSGASDPLDIEGTESDDGEWEADIEP